MNRPLLFQCLMTASLVVGSVAASQAQTLTTSQLLHGGNRCDHVIGLIHRHGVNNSVNRFASAPLLHHSPLGGVMVNQADWGDLQIAQVSQIVDQDPACGPKFAVLIRNQSCRSVCNFHVTAVAVLGRICPVSPSTTVAVGEIAPGQTLQVELTLPLEALAMGNRNGQVIGLQRLVVAIDSFDQLAETNEANNLQALLIGQIPVLAAAVETTVESVPASPVDETATQPVQQGTAVEAGPTGADVDAAPAQTADPLHTAIEKLAVDGSTEVTQ